MSTLVFRIEIETADSGLINDLRNQDLTSVRLMQRAFTCDSVEWQPVIEPTLTFIIEVAKEAEIALVCNWLYERFKERPPQKVVLDETQVFPGHEQIIAELRKLARPGHDVDKNGDK